MWLWSRLESIEFKKLSLLLLEQERQLLSLKSKVEDLDVQFKKLRGRFYQSKQDGAEDEPKDLYSGMFLPEPNGIPQSTREHR